MLSRVVCEVVAVGWWEQESQKGFMLARRQVVAWTARCLTAHEATIAQ
jgi:hypothetical protein